MDLLFKGSNFKITNLNELVSVADLFSLYLQILWNSGNTEKMWFIFYDYADKYPRFSHIWNIYMLPYIQQMQDETSRYKSHILLLKQKFFFIYAGILLDSYCNAERLEIAVDAKDFGKERNRLISVYYCYIKNPFKYISEIFETIYNLIVLFLSQHENNMGNQILELFNLLFVDDRFYDSIPIIVLIESPQYILCLMEQLFSFIKLTSCQTNFSWVQLTISLKDKYCERLSYYTHLNERANFISSDLEESFKIEYCTKYHKFPDLAATILYSFNYPINFVINLDTLKLVRSPNMLFYIILNAYNTNIAIFQSAIDKYEGMSEVFFPHDPLHYFILLMKLVTNYQRSGLQSTFELLNEYKIRYGCSWKVWRLVLIFFYFIVLAL